MARSQSHDFAYLPSDIFWMILVYLGAEDIVRCRRVSRAWHAALTNPAILIPFLKREFPWTTEVKKLNSSSGSANQDSALELFDRVASRCHSLERGKPRSVQTIQLCNNFGSTGDLEWYQVQPWDSHSSQKKILVDRQFPEAFWTVEDNLLVYPSAVHQCLVLRDLETDRQFMVPFIITGKVIRRVRLAKRLLVIEWAEPKAFHWLNDSDGVHRHFASSFDISKNATNGWNIAPRNEWKIMFLGHPLSDRDRFFSSHNNTHYVIYIWQPNRSLYTADEDAPIESLFVWDISKESSYRPSLDPTGQLRDPDTPDDSPHIVSRFSFRDLEFFGVRQRGCPRIQRLSITDDSRAIEISESVTGHQAVPALPLSPSLMSVTTSIPLAGHGPHWQRECEGEIPPYRGSFGLNPEIIGHDGMIPIPLYEMLAHVSTGDVSFCLEFDPFLRSADEVFRLTIQTPRSRCTDDHHVDFAGRGKLAGCERYLVGENSNRELIIYRFDR
ncbi:unnamed protein product [Penicillium salamii]|uniref:F-box domain-containing protein n=1 Tax=Penicillium salamii TaxID=1612424 RepID=A0A9W4JPD2_9EURO|nr:unnamed protein product [Penicillium salamii]CAG8014351.1 unnamed protein product [Penicillium salamii]CAG8016398.1 unnamed protein product [Penicillium salamii]CAG8058698.1 unnamed protein product [Penicillium salamii]CAG8184501.1 unnamed protein product [Penicillium salamii]